MANDGKGTRPSPDGGGSILPLFYYVSTSSVKQTDNEVGTDAHLPAAAAAAAAVSSMIGPPIKAYHAARGVARCVAGAKIDWLYTSMLPVVLAVFAIRQMLYLFSRARRGRRARIFGLNVGVYGFPPGGDFIGSIRHRFIIRPLDGAVGFRWFVGGLVRTCVDSPGALCCPAVYREGKYSAVISRESWGR